MYILTFFYISPLGCCPVLPCSFFLFFDFSAFSSIRPACVSVVRFSRALVCSRFQIELIFHPYHIIKYTFSARPRDFENRKPIVLLYFSFSMFLFFSSLFCLSSRARLCCCCWCGARGAREKKRAGRKKSRRRRYFQQQRRLNVKNKMKVDSSSSSSSSSVGADVGAQWLNATHNMREKKDAYQI